MIRKAKSIGRSYNEMGAMVMGAKTSHNLGFFKSRNWFLSRMGFEPCGVESELRLIYLPPDDIKYVDKFRFIPQKDEGALVGRARGGWDLCREPFEKSMWFKSLRNRFANGTDWEDTEIYQLSYEKVKRATESGDPNQLTISNREWNTLTTYMNPSRL